MTVLSKAMAKLTHIKKGGGVRMVDVSAKPATERVARAHGFVKMKRAVVRAIRKHRTPKGDPLEVARIAGIAAAKRTAELMPLCHPLGLTHIDVTTELCENGIRIASRVASTGPTGVEMEALTAVAVAALNIYDMCKALDRSMEIQDIYLVEKSGGKSGHYIRGKGIRKRR